MTSAKMHGASLKVTLIFGYLRLIRPDSRPGNWNTQFLQDWLYDEGEDETKSVYSQKLEELLRLGSPVEQREKEAQARPAASQALEAAAQHYISLATSEDPKFAHIPGDERNKVCLHSKVLLML